MIVLDTYRKVRRGRRCCWRPLKATLEMGLCCSAHSLGKGTATMLSAAEYSGSKEAADYEHCSNVSKNHKVSCPHHRYRLCYNVSGSHAMPTKLLGSTYGYT